MRGQQQSRRSLFGAMAYSDSHRASRSKALSLPPADHAKKHKKEQLKKQLPSIARLKMEHHLYEEEERNEIHRILESTPASTFIFNLSPSDDYNCIIDAPSQWGHISFINPLSGLNLGDLMRKEEKYERSYL